MDNFLTMDILEDNQSNFKFKGDVVINIDNKFHLDYNAEKSRIKISAFNLDRHAPSIRVYPKTDNSLVVESFIEKKHNTKRIEETGDLC